MLPVYFQAVPLLLLPLLLPPLLLPLLPCWCRSMRRKGWPWSASECTLWRRGPKEVRVELTVHVYFRRQHLLHYTVVCGSRSFLVGRLILSLAFTKLVNLLVCVSPSPFCHHFLLFPLSALPAPFLRVLSAGHIPNGLSLRYTLKAR